jgi:hypothetical protein
MAASSSQWNFLLQHLGSWQGSFTRLSPEGQEVETIPTCVTLEGLDHNQAIRQTIERFSSETGEISETKVLEYRSLNRSTLFFENGAFSQGSMQYGPFSEFGAEMGFVAGDRRMRLVILYSPDGHLSRLTLIREQQQGTDAPERPALTLEQLLGTWQGQATTRYADLRQADSSPTTLSLTQEGDRLDQHLSSHNFSMSSTAQIEGSRLLFEQGQVKHQVVLLPDGASCMVPLSIPRRQPFLLEVGWLLNYNQRQRLIRSYDENGTWISLTLVTETKTSDTQ